MGKTILRIIRILATLAIVGVLAAYIGFYVLTGASITECWNEASEIVENSSLDDFESNETTKFYSDEGELIAKLSREQSTNYLTYEELPEQAVNAFVAVEDRSYWTNPGVDLKGIIRAVVVAVKNHGATQGASTITQQLVRTKYLTRERSILRKIKEIMIAYQLNQQYSKEDIMAAYINNCCFANNIYGVQDAAKAYLGKSASECSIAEIAYLCSIPNRPEYFNPWNDPERAKERQQKILSDMLTMGYITEDEYNEAKEEKIKVVEKKTVDQYNFATTYAIKCATKTIMEDNGFEFKYQFKDDKEFEAYKDEYDLAYQSANEQLYTGGYTIETSLNPARQEALQKILDTKLKSISKKRNEDRIYMLQGAMTAVDNESGKVIAIIGGRAQKATRNIYALNRAFQSRRQPGSSIKPLIVYTPALMGGYKDSTALKNVDVMKAYKNAGHVHDMGGDKVQLRDAVRRSLNGCAVYIMDDLGPKNALKYLSKMKFSSIVPSDARLTAALGGFTYGTNTTEMANAYSTLANSGRFMKADCIVSMISAEGEEIYTEPDRTRVYDSDAVEMMTDILRGVLKEGGTAASMHWYDYTSELASGKTGTTNDSTDGWFCGYTKDFALSVWVGNDDNSPIDNLYGGTYPAEIWRDSMLKLLEFRAKEDDEKFVDDDELEDEQSAESAKKEKKKKNSKPKTTKMWVTIDANVRTAPDPDSEIHTSVSEGHSVDVIEYTDHWTKIWMDGGTYYIYSPLLTDAQ